jgi:hypothetical protein
VLSAALERKRASVMGSSGGCCGRLAVHGEAPRRRDACGGDGRVDPWLGAADDGEEPAALDRWMERLLRGGFTAALRLAVDGAAQRLEEEAITGLSGGSSANGAWNRAESTAASEMVIAMGNNICLGDGWIRAKQVGRWHCSGAGLEQGQRGRRVIGTVGTATRRDRHGGTDLGALRAWSEWRCWLNEAGRAARRRNLGVVGLGVLAVRGRSEWRARSVGTRWHGHSGAQVGKFGRLGWAISIWAARFKWDGPVYSFANIHKLFQISSKAPCSKMHNMIFFLLKILQTWHGYREF